jgi:putative ATP-dependent endonuclease of OLD family
MKLREIIIKNFRNLVDVAIPIEDTTVLVGENNSGKTALLDALRIALPRRVPTGNATPFDEYDYHMCKVEDSPQTSEGIIIELWFREDEPDDWPDSLVQALNEIIQTDPVKDLDSIGLRLSSKYEEDAKEIIKWEFLALDRQPLGGKGANPFNLIKFLSYICLFYLSALRDSKDEFSPRSQFWGRILRDLKISEEQKNELREELTKLNKNLLTVDSRLEEVRASLDNAQKVLALETGQNTAIQALPLKPLELMSKSEVVIRGRGSEVDFPLLRHGQGTQSLAVFFLFQAYIDVLLKPSFEPETEAILALEEPEAHLHPQATRALAANLGKVKSQKIVSSHSPYFIQEIPFTQIRMFRRDGPLSKVLYVKRFFTATVPETPKLETFCQNNSPKFTYHTGTSTLSVNGKIETNEYRDLLTFYPREREVHTELKRLWAESQLYLSQRDLDDLDTYAKRIRGEVLFARAWLLCEGQSEYLLLRYFADLLEKPLDQAGVTVIDFQNNGSPGAFVGLARAFEIPWIMVCDNDEAGKGFITQLKNRGLTGDECIELARPLPEEGMDLEMFLLKNGFEQEYIQILADRKVSLNKKQGEEGFENEIALELRRYKTEYTIALIKKLQTLGADARRVPQFFATAISDVVAKVT